MLHELHANIIQHLIGHDAQRNLRRDGSRYNGGVMRPRSAHAVNRQRRFAPARFERGRRELGDSFQQAEELSFLFIDWPYFVVYGVRPRGVVLIR